MKLQQLALAAVLAAFSYTAVAENGFVGAGSGGPLLSTNGGCVKSQNMGKEFPECMGEKKAEPEAPAPKPVAEKPKQKVVVIRDCARCNAQKQAKRPAAKARVMKKQGKRPPKLRAKKR